MMQRQLFKL